MSTRYLRPVRGLIVTAAIVLFSLGVVRGQTSVPMIPASGASSAEVELAKWGATQGGLLVVVLVVIWSYRRDFARALAGECDRADRATEMMAKATAALVTHTEATRAHTECLDRMSRSIETCKMVQDLLHTRLEAER